MLARAGVKDIFLAYNLVGPNIGRVVRFAQMFPEREARRHGRSSDAGRAAFRGAGGRGPIDRRAARHRHRPAPHRHSARPAGLRTLSPDRPPPGLARGGFHLYDGHNHQKDVAERRPRCWRSGNRPPGFATSWSQRGCPCRRSSPAARRRSPSLRRSTTRQSSSAPARRLPRRRLRRCVSRSAFQPAALLLTRVISRPTPDRITLDLGYKAVASENPLANRVRFPDLPDAKPVLQNEEHLVIETSTRRNGSRRGTSCWPFRNTSARRPPCTSRFT